jgi:hypothetical protein
MALILRESMHTSALVGVLQVIWERTTCLFKLCRPPPGTIPPLIIPLSHEYPTYYISEAQL